jgi:hypothetical protein
VADRTGDRGGGEAFIFMADSLVVASNDHATYKWDLR